MEDAATGDPLAGVNVFLEGTPHGAATDKFGEYVILNIPPGDYTLRASYIGFATYRVQNIRVSLDRTTNRDFTMKTAVIEGEEVIVVADRPLVQKDLTASKRLLHLMKLRSCPWKHF